MGIGTLTIDTAGSVTEPSGFPLVLSSQVLKGDRYTYELPWTFALFSSVKALIASNGYAAMTHAQGTSLFRTGIIAPATAPAVASTGSGARASATFTPGAQPADGDYITLVSAGGEVGYAWRVYFKTSFAVSGDLLRYWQVKRGANQAASLANLEDAINGTATDGDVYRSPTIDAGRQTIDHPARWSDWVTSAAAGATTVVLTAVQYGTGGNAYAAASTIGTFGTGGLMTGGVAGSHSASGTQVPGPGARRWGYAFRRTTDGATSGISPTVGYEQLDDGDVALSSLTDPPASQNELVDAKVWFRTLDGGDVYYEGYSVVTADTTDTDDLDDTTLSESDTYDATLFRTYPDGAVPRYRCLGEKDGRVFGAGFVPDNTYSYGTASVTNGSRLVTLSAGNYIHNWFEHHTFRVTTDASTSAVEYEIVHAAEGGTTFYLDREYEGTTAGTAAYDIRDLRNPFTTGFCEPRFLNVWGPDSEIEGVSGPDPEGITAYASGFDTLIALTRTGIWMLRGDSPDTYSFEHAYEGVGCVGPKAWVMAEGRLYFLSDEGIYKWAPGAIPVKVSAPPVRGGQADGINGTVSRINRTYAGFSVAHFDPENRVVRFFVPLDEDITCRYAIVYDLQSGVWGLDHLGIDVTECRSVGDPAGNLRTLVGDIQGTIWEIDISNSDGAYGFEPVNAITSSTVRTVTCSGASFPTSGNALKGVPVVFVDSSGNFTYNTIASNTGTVLTLARIQTAPTGTCIVGGIHAIMETGRFHLGDPARDKVLGFARVAFSPDTDGQFWFSYASNQGTAAVAGATTDGDLTLTDGEEQFWIRERGRLLRWRIDVVEPGCDPAFLGVLLDVTRREALVG